MAVPTARGLVSALSVGAQAFLDLCESQPEGRLTTPQLQAHYGGAVPDLTDLINELLASHRLKLLMPANDKHPHHIVYEFVPADVAEQQRGLTREDMLILQLIEQSGNMGIWTRDLKSRSNLQQSQVNKALKTLENRDLIKQVRSISTKSKRVYMLKSITPSRQITGGAWYNEQGQFDAEFIEQLASAAHRCISASPTALSAEAVASFLAPISNVALREEDVSQIIHRLLYDGRIERVVNSRGEIHRSVVDGALPPKTWYYRAARMYRQADEPSGYLAAPCGACPVAADCRDGGLVSPSTCVYFDSIAW